MISNLPGKASRTHVESIKASIILDEIARLDERYNMLLEAEPGKLDIKRREPGILFISLQLVSEYDQEISQSQTAKKPMGPRGRATHQSLDTRKTN